MRVHLTPMDQMQGKKWQSQITNVIQKIHNQQSHIVGGGIVVWVCMSAGGV